MLLGAFCMLPVTTADVRAEEQHGAPRVALRTVYLANPVDRAHRITIRGELGGKGTATLDGNTCAVTQFGDTGVCTWIAFPPIDIKIKELSVADSTGQGRKIFSLTGMMESKGYRCFLIVPRRRSMSHRLVVEQEGNDRRRVITLEPVPDIAAPGVRPGLCANAKYRAEQADGRVTIYAKGEHPTPGYMTRFEQLPIEISPLQFRLICVKPAGSVAQVTTPFEVSTSFKGEQSIRVVTVHDAKGRHRVPVESQ